ncbi:hypothetical protein KMZ30_07250 [Phycicoccus sp. KQZ13P-1]|uniref:phage tail fiber protein n=1 Tax=Phycicoccus mangrovi TaxID=2840470 RepID=UPI001C0052A3|nr:hypothetical protein [Phycicoccus mangrovi]MBT9255367.1 hypothetical protein [Phycicoccus mangrovi]
MATGFAAALVNGWLDAAFATASCWVKLHTADPGASGATAAAAGDTSRKQATMAAASGGSKSASGSVGPWTNGGTTETISHISLWSASTAGTFNASAALSASQSWASTNTFTLISLSISVSPVAA